MSSEQSSEGLPELATHGAVDEEIHRIAEQNEQVDELLVEVATLGVEHVQRRGVVHLDDGQS